MTSEVTQADLEPCPFCGGKAEWKDDPKICGVPFGLVVDHKPDCFFAMPMSEEAMLAAWNTRLTAQSGEGRRGAGEDAMREALADIFAAWDAHVEANDRTNAAIPPIDATRAEREVYDERYRASEDAKREWYGAMHRFVMNPAARAALNARQSCEGEDAAEVASELSARDRRTLTDTQRLIWRDDVEGICPTPDMCFEYGDHVRCGPCAIKQAAAHGVASDMSLPSLPEVARLRREASDLSRRVEALAVDLDAHVLVMTNNPDLATEVGNRVRAALRATDDAGGA